MPITLAEASVSHLSTQINDFKYQYDWSGNRTSATLDLGATPTTYTYNAANELTSSTQGSTNLTYNYDADGNLSGWTSGGLSFSYNTLNQTTAISGNNYSYSGADQTDRVQAGNTSYVYSFNGLSSQSDSSGTTYYTRCSCAKGTLIDERTPAGAYYYLFDGLGPSWDSPTAKAPWSRPTSTTPMGTCSVRLGRWPTPGVLRAGTSTAARGSTSLARGTTIRASDAGPSRTRCAVS